MSPFTVNDLLTEKSEELNLELLAGGKGLIRSIRVADINRPGLALANYFDDFRAERIQIIGRGEHSYLQQLSPDNRQAVLERMFSFPELPCIVITRGLEPVGDLQKYSDDKNIPLFRSRLNTAEFIGELTVYLEEKLAPTSIIQGVLVEVYGLGVLITGDSEVGKSECALELLKRGHKFVADDVIEISHYSGGRVLGKGKELIKHFIEVRGLGIIDVVSLFGPGSVLDKTRVELVVHLESHKMDSCTLSDRVGLEDKLIEILGVKIPYLSIPVRPGRNLAVLMEIAALNQRLKKRGIFTARDLDDRLIKILQEKTHLKDSPPNQ